MKGNSVLKQKNMAWGLAGVVVVAILSLFVMHSGAKSTEKAPPPPVIEVAPVEQRNFPVYQGW